MKAVLTLDKFQFHKGTIKTWWCASVVVPPRISIP